jgi:hypothetical protein
LPLAVNWVMLPHMTKALAIVAALSLAALSPAACSTAAQNGVGSEGTGGSTPGATGGKGPGSSSGGSTGTGGSSAGGSGGSSSAATGGGPGNSSGGAPAATGGVSGNPDDAGATGGSSGTGGAPGNPAAGHQFGARPQKYPDGSIRPSGDQGTLDAAIKGAYDKWKAAYVMAACEGYVIKTGGADMTSSPALGTGMILTTIMAGHDPDAQKIFDGLFAVGRKFPSILGITVPAKHGIGPRENNTSLPAYAVGAGCKAVPEGDSAVDGDLDFGFALLLADAQWGSSGKINYLAEAKKTISAIEQYSMSKAKLPLIGDWASLPNEGHWYTDTKPAHFMVGHFRGFAKASGTPYWTEAADAVEATIAEAQTKFSPMAGLLPQYLMGGKTLPGAKVLPDDRNAQAYFDAVGWLPLRFAADYIASGDARSKTALSKINTWIKTTTGGDPAKIVDGYRLDGGALGTKGTMAFVAPFASIAIFDAANQAWLDAAWKLMAAAPSAGWSADTANLLGMLIVTGNWWQP